MLENLGPALRLLREKKSWTQERLGEAARLGKSQISKYESGRDLPKLDSLTRILGALELDLPNFFSVVRAIDEATGDRDACARMLPSTGELQADEAFAELLDSVLHLHRVCAELRMLRPLERSSGLRGGRRGHGREETRQRL